MLEAVFYIAIVLVCGSALIFVAQYFYNAGKEKRKESSEDIEEAIRKSKEETTE